MISIFLISSKSMKKLVLTIVLLSSTFSYSRTWTDNYGRLDIYWIKNGESFSITSSINLISDSFDKGEINSIGLAQSLTIYGSRPVKKHTLYKNVFRLGVQERLIFSKLDFKTEKIDFKPKNSFSKDDEAKLNEYSNYFIEAIKSPDNFSFNTLPTTPTLLEASVT